MKRLSVIIANFNYEHYVGAAIESALALEWGDLEVVVVDDGSTDGSPAVIRKYSDRVKLLMTDNGSQRVAANRGFEMSTGDAVIFLDSDDLLPADLPAKLAAVWTPRVSKVQFQVQPIGKDDVPLGQPYPVYDPVPTSAQISTWVRKTSAYPTPPGSGNAYSRWFLEMIFPVGPLAGDASDSACLATAPFLGEVVSVPGVVVGYRQHDSNDSDLMKDHQRFPREIARARYRWLFALKAAGVVDDGLDETPLYRSRELLQFRVSARRLVPEAHPLPQDNIGRMVRDTFTAPFQVGPEPIRYRVLISAWCLAVLVAPARVAQRLINVRYRRQ